MMPYFTTIVLDNMLKNAKTKHEKMMIIMFIKKHILDNS